MTPNATLSIDDAPEIPCELTVTTQPIDVSSFSGVSKPDLAWTFVDTAGHFHAFDHEGKLPTLETRTVWHAYDEPDDETGETGYEVSTSHCVLCGEEVTAKYVTTFETGRRTAPGRTEWKLIFTGAAPARFSAVVRTGGRTYFGIAEIVYRRGIHHPEEHLAYGGPMSWRPPPAPAWRLDVLAVPPHVTCLRSSDDRLWVPQSGGWFQLSAALMVIPGSGLTIGALIDLAPLVEHPDPRGRHVSAEHRPVHFDGMVGVYCAACAPGLRFDDPRAAWPCALAGSEERCDAKLSAATGEADDLHCERLEGHDGRHLDTGLTWLGDDPDTIEHPRREN